MKSLEIANAINDKEIIVLVGEGLGAIYSDQGKHSEALEALEKSLSLARSLNDRTRIAELLWRQSEVHYKNGAFADAISTASEAAKIAEQLGLQNVSYLALTTLGRAYRATKDEERASEAFNRAIECIERLRGQLAGSEQETQVFFEDKVAPYRDMVDLLLSGGSAKSSLEALHYAERAKGRVLLDALGGNRIKLEKAISQTEKAEDGRLNKEIASLNVRVEMENSKRDSDTVLLRKLNEQLRSARIKYEAFQNSLYSSHPELRIQRRQTPPLSASDLNSLLNRKTAILEYVVTKSNTFLFVLTKSKVDALDLRIYPIAIGEKILNERARDFREMLAEQSPTFADSSRELYDLQIKPASDQLKGKSTLCVIPDGILWDLPFQALQPKDDRYLLEDFAIYYAPSLGVLNEMTSKRRSSAPLPPSCWLLVIRA